MVINITVSLQQNRMAPIKLILYAYYWDKTSCCLVDSYHSLEGT